MIIGHLPLGYLATKLAARVRKARGAEAKAFMVAGLLGSIFPDLDMLYFHLVDHRQHHHHTYWTHIPFYWLGLLLLVSIGLRLIGKRAWLPLVAVFGANVFLHLFADTLVGDIWWLAPFVDKPYALFTVPALYTPWWLNFLLHWSFAIEMGLLAAALFVFWNSNFGKKRVPA